MPGFILGFLSWVCSSFSDEEVYKYKSYPGICFVGLQRTSLTLDGRSCYGQLTPIKSKDLVISSRDYIVGSGLEIIEIASFFKVDRCLGTVF